jgi:hypothetical protein
LRLIHLQVRCLLRLGDLQQIQWLMNNAINNLANIIAAYYQITSSSEGLPGITINGSSTMDEAKRKIPADFDLYTALRDQLYLIEEYLHTEMVIGLSTTEHLAALRKQRDQIKAEFEEYALIQSKKAITAEDLYERTHGTGLYQLPYELSERYDLLGVSLPSNDESLRERSFGRKLLDALTRQDIERKMSRRDPNRRANDKSNADVSSIAADMTNVPYIIREVLVHLPSHNGPLPDIDLCLRQLKNVVLPPRPMSEDGIETTLNATGAKRTREEGVAGSDWLAATTGLEDVEEELVGKPDLDNINLKSDIFRERQRARLLL